MKPPFYFHNKQYEVHKSFLCTYICLIFLYILIIAVYLASAYSDFNDNTIDYFLLLENWRQPTIIDIKPFQNSSLCPNGYSYLIPYIWGGSQGGCDCRNANSVKKIKENWSDLQKGYCSYNQRFWGCNDVDGLSERAMPKWNDTLWCKKTSNDTFISQANLVENSGGCKSGYTKCSSGGRYDNDQVFCSSSNVCPINSIVLAKTAPSADYTESAPFHTYLGNGYSLFWSRTVKNALPIVELRVSEEHLCMNNHENYLSPSHSEYKLSRVDRVQCKEFDNRFQVLDSMSERDFFRANGLENIQSFLPGYTLSDEIQWNLYYRSYILFKVRCRNFMAQLEDSESMASSIKSSIESSVIVMAVFLGIYLISCIVFLIVCGKVKHFSEGKESTIISIILNLLIRMVCIISAGLAKNKVSNFSEIFEFLLSGNCSDDLTNNFFDNMASDLSNSISKDLNIIIFFSVGLIVLDIAIFVGSYFYQNQHKTENQDQLEMGVPLQNFSVDQQIMMPNPIFNNNNLNLQTQANYNHMDFQQPYNNSTTNFQAQEYNHAMGFQPQGFYHNDNTALQQFPYQLGQNPNVGPQVPTFYAGPENKK